MNRLATTIKIRFEAEGFNVDIGDEFINIARDDGMHCEFYGQQDRSFFAASATYDIGNGDEDLDFIMACNVKGRIELDMFVQAVKVILA